MRAIELWMLIQIREGLSPILACKILEEWKYFTFKICPVRELGSWTNLHTCLASKALLKASKSLKLRSFWDLESPRLFHFLQWTPDSFFIDPHQNLDMEETISLHIFLGSANKLMVYIEMAWMMTFKRTSYSAWDKKMFFQFFIWPQTRSLRASKVQYLFHPTNIGSPKYFFELCHYETFEMLRTLDLAAVLVLELKNTPNVCLLIPWPAATS